MSKDEDDNVTYLPKWVTGGRTIRADQSIIYRALRSYLDRLNRSYEEKEAVTLEAESRAPRKESEE